MIQHCRSFSPLMIRLSVATILVGLFGFTAPAEPAQSLVPAFGPAGREFPQKAQPGHEIRGWLPKGWEDISSWAKVSAIYSKIDECPVQGMGAVRIEFTKRDSHHVQ